MENPSLGMFEAAWGKPTPMVRGPAEADPVAGLTDADRTLLADLGFVPSTFLPGQWVQSKNAHDMINSRLQRKEDGMWYLRVWEPGVTTATHAPFRSQELAPLLVWATVEGLLT